MKVNSLQIEYSQSATVLEIGQLKLRKRLRKTIKLCDKKQQNENKFSSHLWLCLTDPRSIEMALIVFIS